MPDGLSLIHISTRTSICIKSRLVSKNNISKTFVLQNKRGIIYLKMVYGYIRVSTDKQTVENQRFEIERFCKKEGLTIDGWIEETISGTKNYSKRALGKLLNRIVKDDLIICTELSRCLLYTSTTDSFVYLFLIAVSQLFDVGFVLLL